MRCGLLIFISVVGLAARTPAQDPVTRSAAADSALVRYAGAVIIEKLAYAMSSAAHTTNQRWWLMTFPPSNVPSLWTELRSFLKNALHGRDSVATDSAGDFLSVGSVRLLDNVMTFHVVIGRVQRCKGEWRGNDQAYDVRTELSGGTWMYPTVKLGIESYSPSCW